MPDPIFFTPLRIGGQAFLRLGKFHFATNNKQRKSRKYGKSRGGKMGLLNNYQQWRTARHEQYISKMRSINKCPDCHGRGFYTFSANEFVNYTNPYDCPNCNGSGSFSEWSELR